MAPHSALFVVVNVEDTPPKATMLITAEISNSDQQLLSIL